MMSHQKKGIHPRPCGIINLSNIISYGRGTLPYLIEVLKNNKFVTVIDAEKLYEDIVYDDMSMPEAAARLIEEIYNAE